MSTATARKSARKSAPAPAPTPLPADAFGTPLPSGVDFVNVSATGPADAPTLQDTLRADAPAPAPAESGDGNTVVFSGHVSALVDCIGRQNKSMLAWYVERGNHVRAGVNVKVAKAVNKQTRDKLRASATSAFQIAAETAYDPTAEPKPRLDVWSALSALAEKFPHAVNLPGVKVALAFAATMTRDDPPPAWNAPETYSMKPRYNAEAVRVLIDRAVSEIMTEADVSAEIERIGGVVTPDAPADKSADPVKAARSLAASILERIQDRKIDPETFFDELQSQLTKFGWALTRGRTANGAETLKPVKTAK